MGEEPSLSTQKLMKILTFLFLVVVAVLMAYIRLAPSDPVVWHSDPALGTTGQTGKKESRLYAATPIELLTRLNAIALATPRTTALAGNPDTGRITWVTRSFIFGFPDYTTAGASLTAEGTRLEIFARLRFGGSDSGVNASRLANWLAQL